MKREKVIALLVIVAIAGAIVWYALRRHAVKLPSSIAGVHALPDGAIAVGGAEHAYWVARVDTDGDVVWLQHVDAEIIVAGQHANITIAGTTVAIRTDREGSDLGDRKSELVGFALADGTKRFTVPIVSDMSGLALRGVGIDATIGDLDGLDTFVIAAAERTGDAFLEGLDPSTGTRRWRIPRDRAWADTLHLGNHVFIQTGSATISIDLTTGAKTTLEPGTGCIVAGEYVYVPPRLDHIVRAKPDGTTIAEFPTPGGALPVACAEYAGKLALLLRVARGDESTWETWIAIMTTAGDVVHQFLIGEDSAPKEASWDGVLPRFVPVIRRPYGAAKELEMVDLEKGEVAWHSRRLASLTLVGTRWYGYPSGGPGKTEVDYVATADERTQMVVFDGATGKLAGARTAPWTDRFEASRVAGGVVVRIGAASALAVESRVLDVMDAATLAQIGGEVRGKDISGALRDEWGGR